MNRSAMTDVTAKGSELPGYRLRRVAQYMRENLRQDLRLAEPIAEVARAVGFRAPTHFTTTFRRVTGMTPSAYRDSCAKP